jgi:Sulfotransferase family
MGVRTEGLTAEIDLDAFESTVIWIFGSGRSGSTWLMRMLGRHPRVVTVNETGIGEHLVNLHPRHGSSPRIEFRRQNDLNAGRPDYFFSDQHADSWRPLLREFVLRRLYASVSSHMEGASIDAPLTVVKEPNGSQSADIILAALPGSGLIFLIRDGRDVVDSTLASVLGDSWGKDFGTQIKEHQRISFIRFRASLWVYQTEIAQRAYEAQPEDRRIMLRYEDLLASTSQTLRAIMDRFGVAISDSDLEAIVAAEAFANIPAEKKGPDKPARSATPGLWRENLTESEQETVMEIMGDKLLELGYPV